MAGLERELATYASNLSELQQSYGKFVLIKGETIEGIFDTYADALRIGYERFKLESFLVKEITAEEQIFQFSRDQLFLCH